MRKLGWGDKCEGDKGVLFGAGIFCSLHDFQTCLTQQQDVKVLMHNKLWPKHSYSSKPNTDSAMNSTPRLLWTSDFPATMIIQEKVFKGEYFNLQLAIVQKF